MRSLKLNKARGKNYDIYTTHYKYVQLDERNVPIIAGTTMKVVELVTSMKAYEWSPEELHANYPISFSTAVL